MIQNLATANPDDVTWVGGKITTADEDPTDADDFGGFAEKTGTTLDAAGNPWVVYSRLVEGNSEDIRARRATPGTGWEVSVIEKFDRMGGRTSNSLAVASGENGDPSVVFERDNGGESDLVFARPFSAPWVVGTPGAFDDVRQSFAPAMTNHPDGSFCLVTSHSTGGGFILPGFPADPFRYTDRKLLTYAGGEVTELDLASSAIPHVANAVATTPDGVVHIISLRKETLAAAAGEVIYTAANNGRPVSDIAGQTIVGEAASGPVSLGSDSAGNLYATYLRPDGGIEIRTLEPDNLGSTWETVATLSVPSPVGIDLAVRADGALGVSYYDSSRSGTGLPEEGAQVRYFSDIDPRTGNRTSAFLDYGAFSLSDRDVPPLNTACAILPDGLPRITFALRGPVKYLRPNTSRSIPFEVFEPIVGFLGSTVDMVARGNEIHLLAHTESEGGTLRHVRFSDADPLPVEENNVFITPGFALKSAARTKVAATIDANGFPVMAAGLFTGTPGTPFNPFAEDVVLLSRPADALDDDSDGIPLLLEQAHCLNRFSPDPLDLLAQSSASRSTNGNVIQGFGVRVPRLPEHPEESGLRVAEFAYLYQVSADLTAWSPETFEAGSVEFAASSSGPITVDSICVDRGISYRYLSSYVEANPRRFSRIEVTRDR